MILEKNISRINPIPQYTTDILPVIKYKTDSIEVARNKRTPTSIRQDLFRENFCEVISVFLLSTYSPYHKLF